MLRLVLGVLRSRRAQAVTLAVLAVLSVAAGTAAPLYATAADRAVVAAELRTATPAERAITFTAEVSAVDGHESSLNDLRGQALAMTGENTLTQAAGVLVPGRAGVGGPSPVSAPVAARDGVCAHLPLLAGTCPAGAGGAVLSDPTARALGVAVGDDLVFQANRAEQPVTLKVAGVYDPAAALRDADPYWAGRVELTPQPLRAVNPIFVDENTVDSLAADTVVAMLDLYAGPDALTADNAAAVAALLKAELGMPGITVANGLPQLLRRIQSTRDVLGLAAPLGAVQLLVVCWFVLLMAVAYTAAGRRTELALGMLRGAPARHRTLLALGPTALVLVLAAPFGVALGWLLVRLLTWATFAGQAPVPLDGTALLAAAGTLLLVMASAAIAEQRAHGGSLLDALRQVPARRGRRFGLLEPAVIVIALAAVGQSYASADDDGGLALLVPLLLALVAGLLTARLIRPAATAYGANLLHRGRLAAGLASLQVARRPGADRLVALTVVAVALVGQTFSAWDVAGAAARERAELELGAARVLTVYAASRPALLDAVRTADPQGTWAMAVTRQPEGGDLLLGVDSSRLAAVAAWPGLADTTAAEVAAALRPKTADPVTVTGGELGLSVYVVTDLGAAMDVSAVLTGPHGEPVTGAFEIGKQVGPAVYRAAVPQCAQAPGCRLAWLSFTRSPHELQLTGLSQFGPDRTLLSATEISSASRWRPQFGAEPEVTLFNGAQARAAAALEGAQAPQPGSKDYISLHYVPADPRHISTDIRLAVADGPVPLPVVAAGPRRLAHTRELSKITPLQALARPADVRHVSPVLPGAAADGVMFDLELADRLADTRDNTVTLQVWLNDQAPADAVDRLRKAGLVPVGDETVAARVVRYQEQGAGLALRLHLAAAVLSVLLVALAMLVLAATDRRGRAAELSALRVQGLPGGAAARAARLGNLAMIAVAAPVGALTAVASWTLSAPARAVLTSAAESLPIPDPDLRVVAPAVVAAAALLLLAALLAGRSLNRATARGDENTAGVRR
ncbi:hypothetical protein Cs7R123_71700 [Catellatospora sp. TT07R-123]|uniref:hypothetical protein n=1 Tax=Catellatospora sp. TT07R-123 TaxID=2733863 RepID=UPI001B0DD642|nr:hypothetical protein [Catellatospora sp. TT07R-123]GHJ49828.1 hypothetical protein Cs7R123_71700 [Catellatospora sp. TT07R-123]